jgi:wyosine [tRNA(Phe)-imidazoG37] synthetase (radical SAM superfamily)
VKTVVITNATLLHRPGVQEALGFLDSHNGEIWAKLEAGTEEYYQLIERTRIPLERVIRNISMAGTKRPIVIQSLFMNMHGQPPPPAEIDAYIAQLNRLCEMSCQIKLVQVYTVARQTAEKFVSPLSSAELEQIAQRVRDIGLKAETYC